MVTLQCGHCSTIVESFLPGRRCERCGGPLEYVLDFKQLRGFKLTGPLNFWRYKPLLPETRNVITMGEGGTPLHGAERLAKEIGLRSVYLKDETRNPTNSFRDRCTALMVSNALDLGYDSIICASNGNLGASLAAYCTKSGLLCHVIVPKTVDMGKLAQMLIYDALIEEHGETVDEAIERADSIGKETGWYQAAAELNPLAIEAQKTIAYEVTEQLGSPNWFIVPLGSGGTIHSIWKGFREMKNLGMLDETPRMIGVQAQGCAPIVEAYLRDKEEVSAVTKPSTQAWGILVGNPLNGAWALKAMKESGGTAVSVSDPEIFTAQQEIARLEGIFAEPASAATLAALQKMVDQNIIDSEDRVVCLITGSGLKATDVLQALTKKRKTAVVGLELSTKEKILRILSQGDTYGYDLWKRLGKTMRRQAVYQHLNTLSERGLIVSHERGGRKYFKITRRGRRALRAIRDLKVLL